MKNFAFVLLGLVLLSAGALFAQVGGNAEFGQTGRLPATNKTARASHIVEKDDHPPTTTATFLEANVLMNVKADEYVAVFAVAAEGETVAVCSQKLEETLRPFLEEIKTLGIVAEDVYVDFIAQNKIFGYTFEADIAKEKLAGFELKKNVSIHYTDQAMLDKILLAATNAQIYDLVKVDYIVKDLSSVQDKLAEAAARVLDKKKSRYGKLLGIKLVPPMQIYAERSSTHFPTELYESYTAAESESVDSSFVRQRYTVQQARKSRTFYYNGLDADGFDEVLNPIITEPTVQFTLYLKVKYEVEQGGAK